MQSVVVVGGAGGVCVCVCVCMFHIVQFYMEMFHQGSAGGCVYVYVCVCVHVFMRM